MFSDWTRYNSNTFESKIFSGTLKSSFIGMLTFSVHTKTINSDLNFQWFRRLQSDRWTRKYPLCTICIDGSSTICLGHCLWQHKVLGHSPINSHRHHNAHHPILHKWTSASFRVILLLCVQSNTGLTGYQFIE